MDYLNGPLGKLYKWIDYPKLPTLKKKDNQSLVVLIDVPLPSPSYYYYYYYYYFNDAGQLFYRRIDSSHVMADTLGGEQQFSLAEASKNCIMMTVRISV